MTLFEVVKTIFLFITVIVLLVLLKLLKVTIWCEEAKQNEKRS